MLFLILLWVLIGPRATILIWWAIDMSRWEAAFGSFLWPIAGFLFLPWTTLAYALVAAHGGVAGADWLLLAIALFLDLASHVGSGGYRMRSQRRRVYR